MLGLAQCAKRPNMPTLGGVEPSTKTITFTTNGGGDKGNFTQVSDVLNYKWDMNNDVIHVYIQEGGDAFTGEHYVGVMDMTDLSDDGYTATFSGTFTDEFPTNGWIRFVHYGRSINVNEKGAMEEAVSFSAQDGTLQTISDNVVAICDKKITEDCAYNFNCDLTVQFAVVKFTFGAFEGEGDVTLYRLAKNGLKVNTTGAVEYTDGTSSTLEGMDVNKTEYYTVLMPKSETSYIFTDGSKVAYKKAPATAGVFYTKNAAGEPVTIDVIPDVLPGVFSVAPGKQVCFSKGNLQYLPCGLPAASGPYVDMFRFADNQWDYLGDGEKWGVKLEGYTEYNKPDGTRSAARDLFGWGTACLDGTSVPWQCTKDNSLYGPASGNLNEGEASGANYEKYDWGHLMAPANMWRTLSASEFKYVFESRNGSNEYHTQGNKMLGGYGWLTLSDKSKRYGAFILPDDYYCTTDGRPEYTGKTGWSYTSADLDDYKIVFLPVGGYREGGELINIGTGGHSWTSTAKDYAHAIIIDYNTDEQQIDFDKKFDRFEGANVRLVLNR